MGSCESGHQGLEQETSHQGRQRGPTALYRFSLCFTADYGDAGTGPAEDRLPSLRASLSASAQLRLLPIADDEDSLRLFDFNTSLPISIADCHRCGPAPDAPQTLESSRPHSYRRVDRRC